MQREFKIMLLISSMTVNSISIIKNKGQNSISVAGSEKQQIFRYTPFYLQKISSSLSEPFNVSKKNVNFI